MIDPTLMADRPRIQFLVDRPRHAQARIAHAISRRLAADYHCRVRYEADRPDLVDTPCDLLVVMSWNSRWYQQFDFEPSRVVKSVLDHGWSGAGEGALSAKSFVERWLADAETVTCCSQRLRDELEPHREVLVTRPGFDPFVFPAPRAAWQGPLRFGWAGDKDDPTLGYRDILVGACGDDVDVRVSDGDPQLAAIGAFFRSMDVFVLASEHEGAPLTLIEAMASGCFPVCVDVGVVPEWIQHGQNGLIVSRDPSAFREAFQWCQEHPDQVRRSGLREAERLRHRLTWEHVIEDWRRVFESALATSSVRHESADSTVDSAIVLPATPPRRVSASVKSLNAAKPPARKVASQGGPPGALGRSSRVGVLGPNSQSSLEVAFVEGLLRREGNEIVRVPLHRAPNDQEKDLLRRCSRLVACVGDEDLERLCCDGTSALSASVARQLDRPLSLIGVRLERHAGVRAVARTLGSCLETSVPGVPRLAATDPQTALWLRESELWSADAICLSGPSAMAAAGFFHDRGCGLTPGLASESSFDTSSSRRLGVPVGSGLAAECPEAIVIWGRGAGPSENALLHEVCASYRPKIYVSDLSTVGPAVACARMFDLDFYALDGMSACADVLARNHGRREVWTADFEVAALARGLGCHVAWIDASHPNRSWHGRAAQWLAIPKVRSLVDPRTRPRVATAPLPELDAIEDVVLAQSARIEALDTAPGIA